MSFHYKPFPPLSLAQSFNLSKHFYLSKKIVLVSNIPKFLFSKDILYQKKFLGQYGHIKQMIFTQNQKKEKNIITQFDTVNQAALAVLSLNNFNINNDIKLKAIYFKTKYCINTLNNKDCNDVNCLFLHDLNIDEYSYIQLKNRNYFDSYKIALDIIHIEKNDFEIIYNKLIGENYYELYSKFPKMTLKRLKNKEYKKNLFQQENEKNQIVFKRISDNINTTRNNIDENQKSSTDNSSDLNKFSNNLIFKKRKFSRFNFVNNKIKLSLSVIIPDFFLDFLDKIITLRYNEKNNNDKRNLLYINDYNCNWNELIKKLKFKGILFN